ncbi:MAG: hypothetical protein P8019_06520 [Gammaproteobacteria bacterium]
MTTVAGMGCLTVFFAGLVTLPACHLAMLSAQFKVSKIMIKRQLVELNDIRIAALVVGMTAFTGLAPDRRHTPVVTHVIVDVLADFPVAIQAQDSLPGAVEAIMTPGTFVIEPGMTLDKLAWTDQRLNTGGPASHGETQ